MASCDLGCLALWPPPGTALLCHVTGGGCDPQPRSAPPGFLPPLPQASTTSSTTTALPSARTGCWTATAPWGRRSTPPAAPSSTPCATGASWSRGCGRRRCAREAVAAAQHRGGCASPAAGLSVGLPAARMRHGWGCARCALARLGLSFCPHTFCLPQIGHSWRVTEVRGLAVRTGCFCYLTCSPAAVIHPEHALARAAHHLYTLCMPPSPPPSPCDLPPLRFERPLRAPLACAAPRRTSCPPGTTL